MLAGRGGRPPADDQQYPAGLARAGAGGPSGGERGRLVQRVLQGGDGVLPSRRRGPGVEGGEEFGRGRATTGARSSTPALAQVVS
ncbi:hypothetical protein NQP46_02365 [Streptomyces albus]|nr:hypothetical protein NQP46_02365 [Streptomyces albus]